MRLTECVARCLAAEKAANGSFEAGGAPPGLVQETWLEYWDEALRIVGSLDRTPRFGCRRQFTPGVQSEIAWAARQLHDPPVTLSLPRT